MTKSFVKLIMCLALVSATAAFTQGATVGYWQFNEKAPGQQADGTAGAIIDSSVKGHHGTAVGSTLPSYAAGPNDPTSAISLTIGNDRVEVPHSADFNLMFADLQDYTIEAIVKMPPREDIAGAVIASKLEVLGDGWVFRTRPTGVLALYIQDAGVTSLYPDATGTTNVLDGMWHHVAVVIDTNADPALTSATFYVDHVQDGTTLLTDVCYDVSPYTGDWTNRNFDNTEDILIGDFLGRAGDQLVGDIDAVRFSTGMLTAAEFLDFTPPRPGDANGDGAVDTADAAILAANWLGAGGWAQGNFNGDGIVDDIDATMLATNWTATSGTSVPEPGSIALLIVGLVGLLFWRRCR